MKELPIRTEMWGDPYFVSLNKEEKLLWVYLLTNPSINIAGIMREGILLLAMHCSITPDEASSAMERFVTDKKVLYQDNFIFVTNWIEYHCYTERVRAGVDKCIDSIPEWFQSEVRDVLMGLDTHSSPIPVGIDTHVSKSNSKSEDNNNDNILKTKSNSDSKPEKIFDWELIKKVWNEFADMFDNIKAVNKITTTRKAKIKTRSGEGFDLIEKQPEVLEAITNSDFLQGKSGGRKWSINFDFLFHNDTNWVKIIEGGYGGKGGNSKGNAEF